MMSAMTVYAQTVKQFLRRSDQWRGPYDIVFADPPYTDARDTELLFNEVAEDRLFTQDAWLVVEHGEKTNLPDRLGRSKFLRRYVYGDTALSLYAYTGGGLS